LYLSVYDRVLDSTPQDQIDFVNVKEPTVRVPSILKKFKLSDCFTENLLMPSFATLCGAEKVPIVGHLLRSLV